MEDTSTVLGQAYYVLFTAALIFLAIMVVL